MAFKSAPPTPSPRESARAAFEASATGDAFAAEVLASARAATGAEGLSARLAACQLLLGDCFDALRGGHVAGEPSNSLRETYAELVLTTQQVANAAGAAQQIALARFAAVVADEDPETGEVRETEHSLGHVEEFAADELAPIMHWTARTAGNRVQDAAAVVTKTPRLLAAAGEGAIDIWRVTAIADELCNASPDTCRRVEDALMERGVCQWTPRRAQRAARSLVERFEADAAKKAQERTIRERLGLWFEPGRERGLSDLHATMRAEDAARLETALESHARELHRANTTGKTLSECRVDALIDLATGNSRINAHFIVHVPVEGLADDGDQTDSEQTDAANAESCRHAQPTGGGGRRAESACPTGVVPEPTPDEPEDWPFDPEDSDSPFDRNDAAAEADWAAAFDRWWERANTEGTPEHEALQRQSAYAESHEGDGHDDGAPPPGMSWDDWLAHLDRESQQWFEAVPDLWPEPPPDDDETSGQRHTCGTTEADIDGVIPGVGVIPAHIVRQLMRNVDTRIGRALVDARTGVVLSTTTTVYRPSGTMAEFVRTRDGHCRFPGCLAPARSCDLDHVIPWQRGGPTTPTNLQSLCRHHHRLKTDTSWRVTMTDTGVCTWTSPLGRTYVTTPDGPFDLTSAALGRRTENASQPARITA
ncbi:DUF222 domain-containing protein [Calidifontibacter sp. DB0510]|uniref:DUF222 domain-containing protein n=1 Tax=Metallococcus carri TaxID=1656884 RepID=A0A967B3B3_9MICO|nr:HNH endonuclease signature motif containing protein [Metallococcus carri]NHN54882.1 DUF222 domain-containing protein [Metallococcus carri]NOP37227.1 DUF222 domain-containing protein [Calidifontibacter sp. DB2511S]